MCCAYREVSLQCHSAGFHAVTTSPATLQAVSLCWSRTLQRPTMVPVCRGSTSASSSCPLGRSFFGQVSSVSSRQPLKRFPLCSPGSPETNSLTNMYLMRLRSPSSSAWHHGQPIALAWLHGRATMSTSSTSRVAVISGELRRFIGDFSPTRTESCGVQLQAGVHPRRTVRPAMGMVDR